MAKIARYGLVLVAGYGLALATPFALEAMGYGFEEPQAKVEELRVCPAGAQAIWYNQQFDEGFPVQAVMECQTAEGVAHGSLIKWERGNLFSVAHMQNGTPEGTGLVWGDGGRKFVMQDSSGGKARNREAWNEAGILTFRQTWNIDDHSSLITHWYDSGIEQYRVEGRFEAPHGSYESWYESGQPHARGSYSDGNRVGTWQCWNESGQETTTVVYDQEGVLLSRSVPTRDWTASCTRADLDCAWFNSFTKEDSQHFCGRRSLPPARPPA